MHFKEPTTVLLETVLFAFVSAGKITQAPLYNIFICEVFSFVIGHYYYEN